ncbi:MAG: hypothetical protein CML67_10155 [Rhodobacteraceae bacterium]|nr:hypothetical protein [Paracoccaceae bacterium]
MGPVRAGLASDGGKGNDEVVDRRVAEQKHAVVGGTGRRQEEHSGLFLFVRRLAARLAKV